MSDRIEAVGGCYCGAIRFEVAGTPYMKGQCHCRACQHISGGGPNYFFTVHSQAFRYTKGTPQQFTRADLPNPRTRDFCPVCGTHLVTRIPDTPLTVVKAGVLDDPNVYGGPEVAIYCEDIADFHTVPEGVPMFDTLPPQRK